MNDQAELTAIKERYARRSRAYDPLSDWMIFSRQERERAVARLLRDTGFGDCSQLRLLEIGCGNGDNLLFFLGAGFQASSLVGNELLPERVVRAAGRLPAATRIVSGNAAELNEADLGQFDIVFQSMVLSSILDSDLRFRVAEKLWSLVRPGGIAISYDLMVNNPNNPDVRKVTHGELVRFFPGADSRKHRVTLAPPLSRRISRLGHWAYLCANACSLFRSHQLCLFQKPTHNTR